MGRQVLAALAALGISFAAGAEIFGSEVGGDNLVRIDVATRAGLSVGPYSDGSFNLNGLDGDAATGRIWGLDAGSGKLYSVNAATGTATAITGGLFTGNANGLAYDANRDRLWISTNGGQIQFYDLGTAQHGVLGNTGLNNLEGLAYDSVSRTLYALRDTDDRIYTIATDNLAWSAISPNLEAGNWRGLTFDSSTGHLIASRVGTSTYIVEFDPSTGQVMASGELAGVGNFVQGLAYVPAPGSLVLLGIGGLVLARRGR